MTTSSIRFRCPACRARIRAPLELGGRRRPCPRCREIMCVPLNHAEPARPILVMLEGEERFALRVRQRRPA
jgi:hypothetical protein